MHWYEILIIVLAVCFVVAVVVWQIVRRAQGKGGCDCGCANCNGACPHCTQKKEK